MGRAEVGSTKYLSNKLKSKGLQRLRWYCQICERQMRDENGFKCHTQSESHVRQMLIVGEDPRKYIEQYSKDFQHDFLQQLRTSHGEKSVNINHFYQEYIAHKEHIHMNATKWPSLTEFAKYLGREGICRVEEGDKGGLHVAWIDNSPDALRRQAALRKRERQDRGDEEREQKLIEDQIRRAHRDKEAAGLDDTDVDETSRALQVSEGEKIKLNFGVKPAAAVDTKSPTPESAKGAESESPTTSTPAPPSSEDKEPSAPPAEKQQPQQQQQQQQQQQPIKFGAISTKPKNVFATAARKNPLAAGKRKAETPPKPLSAIERVMKEDMERKRARETKGVGSSPSFAGNKRQRVS
ncbi:hypothetical protein AJ80_02729 [Polytolypa hystricis UAMH7299]|uniref:C2H2-type domain-containing protein n=1 Tax=Polytolypa hystricis (strain UAMH7299) TaxID=1447883 RepID=A0A2B7YQ80_POLH7|nr:hypothetical protein AJ80_02729 [Polytolypa hystricis UAMH7299]